MKRHWNGRVVPALRDAERIVQHDREHQGVLGGAQVEGAGVRVQHRLGFAENPLEQAVDVFLGRQRTPDVDQTPILPRQTVIALPGIYVFIRHAGFVEISRTRLRVILTQVPGEAP